MAERFTITYQYGYYHVSIPNYDGGEVVDAESFDALVTGLKKLILAYVSLLEIGRDRIIALGGSCDPVDVMDAGDPSLRAARAALAGVGVGGAPK